MANIPVRCAARHFSLAHHAQAEDELGVLEKILHSSWSWATASLVALAISVGFELRAAEEFLTSATNDLTFFGWSDQHVQSNGEAAHLHAAIDAMNALPGTPYPEGFGGAVHQPAFVFGGGDITEWPSAAARDAYAELIDHRLKWPSYEILGNHDEGGSSPAETMKEWLIRRRGSLSYTFDAAGVHFIALFSHYDESLRNPSQALSNEALEFLRADLKRQPAGTPVVVAMHLCLDALTNRDRLLDALGDSNVILILAGHYHKAQVDRYRKLNFLQLPSPAPNGEREFMVIRILPGRLLALPYNYEKRQWVSDPRKTLDLSIVSRQ